MRKIGIVTYYNALNCGAFLQAFALQSFLKEQGFTPFFIPILKFEQNKTQQEDAGLTFRNQIFEKLGKCHSMLNIAVGNENFYDAIIYGSDEIWNIRNHGWRPKLWGYGCKSSRKLSYAPCIGNTKFQDFFLFPYIIIGLNRFDSISVRDGYSKKILSHFVKGPIKEVLDPTFLSSYTQYKKENVYGDYVLVYTYGLNNSTIYNIKQFAKKRNLKIICTGSYQPWADLCLSADPFEWISLIYNARYVITSTFHGTVFSIICKKQFCVVDTSSMKVVDVLEKVNLKNRKSGDITQTFSSDIDYDVVGKSLCVLIDESMDYLLKALAYE